MASPALDVTLEALLFTAGEAMSAAQLSKATGEPAEDVTAALATLRARLTGGIRLAETAGSYRLVTAPETAASLRQFIEDTSRQDLTRPALETLAIIAYQGPVTKSQIEAVRGVASEAMLRNLLARDLITTAGHSPEPGRPVLYAVSHTFLQHFGLTSTQDLPPLPDASHEN